MYEKSIVHTDHNALHSLMTIMRPSGRLVCWSFRLAESDFEVNYELGKVNQQSDALWTLCTELETTKNDDDDDIRAFLLDDIVDTSPTSSVEHNFMDMSYPS